MGANDVNLNILTNAKLVVGELRNVNAELANINLSLNEMNTKGAAGATKHKSAIASLALRFVGYNLILNQVMGAQQKLINYVGESIQKYREFQTRIAEVSTIMTGDFQPALTSLQASVEHLSVSFGKSTSDLSKGLYDIMSAAFSANEAIALLDTSTKAAIAGLSDIRTSTDIFTTVLNTYGMSAYEATKVSDTLFQSVVRGKFQFEDLESALGYVVPIAAQAGIAFDELMAALSTATRHGLHLDMASRGLAMAIQNIINPSEGAAKAARQFGLDMGGLALRVKGLTGFFSDLQEKTKEYGKVVLNEVIPNIRSLRVAMVLAGEEGLQGMMDDFDLLQVAGGRTQQALEKIMKTSEFVSNQISQQWEATQRDVGKAWDELAIAGQRTVTTIAADWGNLLPVIGPIVSVLDYLTDQQRQAKAEMIATKYYAPQGEKYSLERMRVYLDLQKEIRTVSDQITRKMSKGEGYEEELAYLDMLIAKSSELQDAFNQAFGEPVLGAINTLEDLAVQLDEIGFDIERLKKDLKEPITYGWSLLNAETGEIGPGVIEGQLYYKKELLTAEQNLADVRYDVKMGLIDETYIYKVLNAEQQEAVRIMREHERATEAAARATAILNKEYKLLQIQMLEIQLAGMMRRRGLTRSEEKKLKKLQIEQLKLQIANMKATVEAEKVDESAYFAAKDMIDKYIASKENEVYQLKYTYDQERADLDEMIKDEERQLAERQQWWEDTNTQIATSSQELMTRLKEIFSDAELTKLFEEHGISILELLNKVESLVGAEKTVLGEAENIIATPTPTPEPAVTQTKTSGGGGDFVLNTVLKAFMGIGNLVGQFFTMPHYDTGIKYVPETGPAILHRGETVLSAGANVGQAGGDTIIEHVTIQVQQLADITDVDKFAALVSSAQNVGVLNKRGRTKFRMR